MQTLIDFITKNLLALWPVGRVYGWEQGLRVRGGIPREILPPGLCWRWWFLDEIYRVHTTERTIELCPGCVTTADGHVVTISANLSYRVMDVRQLWMRVSGTDSNIRNLASGITASAVARAPWNVIAGNRRLFNRTLLKELESAFAEWGITVTRVHLVDLAPARAIRLVQDNYRATL